MTWPARCCCCTARTTMTIITPAAPAESVYRIMGQGTGFRLGPAARRRGPRCQRTRPRALSDVRPGVGRLPVLPRGGSGEKARRGAHFGADGIFGGGAALRDIRGDPVRRRRSGPGPVMPAAGRQHQARCRRRVPGRGVLRAFARRRLDQRSPAGVFRPLQFGPPPHAGTQRLVVVPGRPAAAARYRRRHRRTCAFSMAGISS